MKNGFRIVSVNERNISEHPHIICFINPKHESYPIKIDWLKQRFAEGYTIKLLYLEGEKRPVGFIEYTTGENAWRAVSAEDYLFIHCIWVSANKYKNKGIGTTLVNDCYEDAMSRGRRGVAVVTSSGSFMAEGDIFRKCGFEAVEEAEPHYELWVKTVKKGPLPRFNDWKKELAQYTGLNIVYSKQCPWVSRFVEEIGNNKKYNQLKLNITELQTPQDAQKAPSPYSTFNLIFNGKLLADHYISETRFKNILKKEKLM
ncbi:GNAT family N-acetyltransferase [Candidatus Latescibacterota bacterium]